MNEDEIDGEATEQPPIASIGTPPGPGDRGGNEDGETVQGEKRQHGLSGRHPASMAAGGGSGSRDGIADYCRLAPEPTAARAPYRR